MTSHAETVETLREANAIQAERILQLEAALRSNEPLSAIPGLTGKTTALLRVLLKFDVASMDQILFSLYGSAVSADGRDKYNVRPIVTYLRRTLVPYGVCINPVWGIGYRMPPGDKTVLRSLMAGVGA